MNRDDMMGVFGQALNEKFREAIALYIDKRISKELLKQRFYEAQKDLPRWYWSERGFEFNASFKDGLNGEETNAFTFAYLALMDRLNGVKNERKWYEIWKAE